MKKTELSNVKVGKTFKIGEIEFIKFSDIDGITIAVSKDIVFRLEFGNNNNLAESDVLEKLNKEILPELIKEVGEENILEFETDLTTLDGLKPYEPLKSKISIPSFDFYRANVEMFDKYKVDSWWWLATPDTAKPHYNPSWRLCVSPDGYIGFNLYDYGKYGVRPFLKFVSSIFVSCEE